MKPKQKTALYEVWENFGLKNNIYYPDEIFSFLEKAIEATNGRLNVDFYGGGYADELCAIKRIDDFFYLYWKNFEDYFSRVDELTEFEIMNYQCFGGNTFIYQVMNINNLEILEHKGEIYIVIRCNYTTKKELLSSIITTFKISKENIIEIESGHYIEFLFKDLNGYNTVVNLYRFLLIR